MDRGRAAVVATLVVAVALGAGATLAIRAAARRRVALVGDLLARLPPVPGARLLAPWEPAPDDDAAHATYCLDDADPAGGAARFASALTTGAWRADEIRPHPPSSAVPFALRSEGYRLRGVAQPGRRPDCDGARRQVTLTVEAARGR